MSDSARMPELPPALRRILDAVRRRIRAYVWIEGFAAIVALVGAVFWAGMALDWMFEPSPAIRQAALGFVAIAAGYVGYRFLLRRLLVPISDASAAALLERRFPRLNDHLLTAVDFAASPERASAYHPAFIQETQQSAVREIAQLDPSELFNRGPLLRTVTSAVVLAASVVTFALVAPATFSFWLERIALSEQPWPRRVHLEVVGFPQDAGGRRVHKLAQDDNYELLVQASTAGYEVPSEVEIRFRLADGRRGRDTMVRVGQADGGQAQLFRYQFKRVSGDMEFDVVGGDDRVRDLRLEVVDRPELVAIELACVYPDYLQREPRQLPITGGMRIPEGTRLTLRSRSTKPLAAARIHRAKEKSDARLAFSGKERDQLVWEYGTLAEDDVLLVSVTDTDGVSSREPYRISLSVVPDEVPQVAVRLAGIGSAITPEAFLPLVGKVTDDYGLDRTWFEYQVDGGPVATRPLAELGGEPLLVVGAANRAAPGEGSLRLRGPTISDPFDTRTVDPTTGKRALELRPGQRFSFWLKASDRYDLNDDRSGGADAETEQAEPAARVGSSQQFTLDVVTAGDLLALLERRELALRQRYESIYEKVTDTRNLLHRVEFEQPSAANILEGGEAAAPEGAAASAADSKEGATNDARALARRRLRIAGSLQNVVQSADEIAGVADGFDDLGDQLTNNRIDNPDLQRRLREQIAQPLHQIAERRMPQLSAQLKLLEQHVADSRIASPELAKSLALADEILVEMKQVLDRMLELETYNEVVSLLRDIISDQEKIHQRTKQQQRERLRSLFEE